MAKQKQNALATKSRRLKEAQREISLFRSKHFVVLRGKTKYGNHVVGFIYANVAKKGNGVFAAEYVMRSPQFFHTPIGKNADCHVCDGEVPFN